MVLGEHDLSRTDESNQVEYKIVRIVVHPHYSPAFMRFDVSLWQLERKVDFRRYPHIRPICLPHNDRDTYAGKIATATGWGMTSNDKTYPDKLLEVNVKVLSNKDCINSHQWKSYDITYEKMCAYGNGVRGTCGGDSGWQEFEPSRC